MNRKQLLQRETYEMGGRCQSSQQKVGARHENFVQRNKPAAIWKRHYILMLVWNYSQADTTADLSPQMSFLRQLLCERNLSVYQLKLSQRNCQDFFQAVSLKINIDEQGIRLRRPPFRHLC